MLRADRTACIVLMLPDEAVFECCSAALERKSAGGRERDSEAERVEGMHACIGGPDPAQKSDTNTRVFV